MSASPLDPPAEPYPLESVWADLQARIRADAPPRPTGLTRTTYLDAAERIVRSLAAWQDEHGLIADPWAAERYYVENRDGRRVLVHTQARYLGALGQLLRAGRCLDLVEAGVAAYEERLRHLDEVHLSPEFYTKELVWAHLGLREKVEPARAQSWEAVWAASDPWASYRCASTGRIAGHNGVAFALAGECARAWAGLGGSTALVEEALTCLGGGITEWGMYRDPHDPMTYNLVVVQQLELVRHLGYDGPRAGWIDETCRRGAITSLLMQSACGQMPFGGRSNQFHLMEGHFACLCETRAARSRGRGDDLTAAVFRRAGRRAVGLTLPWIVEMEPFRHTKQGFPPQLGHGVDSGGPYSVYGALAASLLATAYHLADDPVDAVADEAATPVEIGGYAFDLWPAFHKVFAAAGTYSLEVDTCADLEKDATGLGRLHRAGVWPETALSGSIAASATYDMGVPPPVANLAIGPVWRTSDGAERRLADLSDEIAEVELVNLPVDGQTVSDGDTMQFEIVYRGDLGGLRRIVETFRLTDAGLEYSVRAEPAPASLHILVPVIESDGEAAGSLCEAPQGLTVHYRHAAYEVRAPEGAACRLRDDPPAANRNALYRTAEIEAERVFLSLESLPC